MKLSTLVLALLIVATLVHSGNHVQFGMSAFRAVDGKQVGYQLRKGGEVPLRPSPDGGLIVYSAASDSQAFGLEVRDANSNEKIAATYSNFPILRVAWRPDSKAIAFFRQDQTSRRQLALWEIASNSICDIPTPPTHNQYEVKWSPNSQYLAYSSDGKAIVIVDKTGCYNLIHGNWRSFSWNSTSNAIAAISDEEGCNELCICDPSEGRIINKIRIPEAGKLVSVQWEPNTRILLRAQSVDKLTSSIYNIDAMDPKSISTHKILGETSEPRFCQSDENILIWTKRSKNTTSELIVYNRTTGIEISQPFEGSIRFLQFSRDGRRAIIMHTSPLQYNLLELDLGNEGKSHTKILASAIGNAKEQERHQRIFLESSCDEGFSIDLWKPMQSFHRSAAIIRVLGGSSPEYAANWSERKLYLRNGLIYASISSRGATTADDVLRACEYLNQVCSIDYQNIVVYGQSSGATIALEAAVRNPNVMGTLVVVGLSEAPTGRPRNEMKHLRVLAFHGGNDPIPPEIGRNIIVASLGNMAIVPPQGSWHVFPHEAHSFRIEEASIHAAILNELAR